MKCPKCQFEFDDKLLKIPQIGWNTVVLEGASPLTSEIANESYVYFNHGYYCVPDDTTSSLAKTDYGIQFTSIVNVKNVYGVQFHPEKSQKIGMQILKNFVEKII